MTGLAIAAAMNLALGILLVIKLRQEDLSSMPGEYATGQVQRRADGSASYVGLPRRPRHREPLAPRLRGQAARHIRNAVRRHG